MLMCLLTSVRARAFRVAADRQPWADARNQSRPQQPFEPPVGAGAAESLPAEKSLMQSKKTATLNCVAKSKI